MKPFQNCLASLILIVTLQSAKVSGFHVAHDVRNQRLRSSSPTSYSSSSSSKLLMAESNVTATTSLTMDDATMQTTAAVPVNASTAKKRFREVVIEEYEGYCRSLSPREARKEVEFEFENTDENDNGDVSIWFKPIRKVKKAVRKAVRTVKRKANKNRKTKKPGALILVRCVQSTFNENHTFTGWLDPPITEEGVQECGRIGRILVAEGFDDLDVVYTSRLQRSVSTAWNVLETMGSLFIPVKKTFRLNNRMYGALEGLSKEETVQEFGPTVVDAWRNSLKARPPPLSKADPAHPRFDRKYSDLPEDKIPDTESLLECQDRARQLWEYQIRDDIAQGKNVLVVAHRDSIRGLCTAIDNVQDEKDISNIDVPRGVPLLYRFDHNMDPIVPSHKKKKSSGLEEGTPTITNATFLEKPENLELALIKNDQWQFNPSFLVGKKDADGSGRNDRNRRVSSLSESLEKLRDTDPSVTSVDEVNDEVNDENTISRQESAPVAERWADDPCEFEEYDFFDAEVEAPIAVPVVPLSSSLNDDKTTPALSSGGQVTVTPKSKDGPFVVLIRHGRTPHNNMQLFTGWEDPPLATEGVDDAKNAGRLLKRHGFEFDVCYTSWLTRAIQTAYYALDELDQVWIPMIKSWRLNERMYGDLTGKSKKMIANEYGEDQLKRWRRGYTIRPPAVSSYSLNYPGNDERRAKHFKDLPISIRESINRSIERRKPTIHRKFPKTESLKDCMDRSIPFYTERIRREAVDNGKRVLITSHENAIRGILMYLCDIPEEAMNQLHLPNGLPLIYNVRGRCISLLDDGSGRDPMEVHDFGPAAKYLFKPCELDDAFFDEMEKANTVAQ